MCNVEQGTKVLQPFAQACTLLNETSLKTNMYCDLVKILLLVWSALTTGKHLVMKPIVSPLALMKGGLICKWKQPV